jgi:hypothetical protein
MKSISRILISGLIITTGIFSSCNSNHEAQVAESSTAVSTDAAGNTVKDGARQFVKTADMKFRVQNVTDVTYKIEALTSSAGGFVTHSGLNSIIDGQSLTSVSPDSSVETLRFTVTNDITIRVPDEQLDTTLKAIAALTEYLDHRNISAEDVALRIKANEKAVKRPQLFTAGHKSSTLSQTAIDLQKQADDADIANLSLRDQINYSTVTLSIYQRQETKRWLVANDKGITAYQPGLALRLWDSVKIGWHFIEEVLVLLTRLWLLFVLALLGYFLFKRYKKTGSINSKA